MSVSLEPGKPVERELTGGQSHSYKLAMISGQYSRIVVEQRGIDVALALFTPDGKKIGEVNGEQTTMGAETTSAIAEVAGAYRIEVHSAKNTAKAGRYEIKVEELREAIAEDKYRIAAELVYQQAWQLDSGTLEDKRKSIEKYQEALDLFRRASDRRLEAKSLNKIGEVYWLLGETQKALEKFNETLPIRQAVGDRHGEAETLNNIGVVYWSMGETQKALEKYSEALPIKREIGDRDGEAITLSTMGLGYWSLGDMQKALEHFSKSLPIRREVGDRGGEAITLNNIGLVYWSLGDMQKALEKYNEALPISRAVGNRSGEVVTLANIGMIYRSLGEMRKALDNFNEALLISRAIKNRDSEAGTLNQIGLVYWSLGDMQKALEKYNEALPISQAIGNRRLEAGLLVHIGEARSSLGEMQKALEKFNDALLIIGAVGDRSGEVSALLDIARVEQKRGNLTQARQTIEQAISIVESVRAKVETQELRASYLAKRQEYYQSYIDILMEQHRQNQSAGFDAQAFTVSERARARSLLELLTESRADIRQGVDISLLERERSLQRLLNTKAAAQFALLSRKHSPAQAEAFAKDIDSIITEYEELRAQIRARNPRYATMTQPQPLSLAEIQQQVLDPDTLLLEYSLGEDSSYLFVVSQTSITWSQLPKRAEIEEATRRVRELLTAPQRQPGDTEAKYQARVKEAREGYWAQAAQLSRMLLGPIASQLGKKRLAIVADGALQYIPFAALPAPSPGNDGGR
ncbi:MAG TPA: tetratricopeptide repeat protein, partial [Pyrinomonadaceae bacterium]|nr:tetratricopeptide repeat protein [Pyrinomonadaceae bacterium]